MKHPILLASLLAAALVAQALDYPPAAQHAVVNSYHGNNVTDDYQWLENFDDGATQSWLAGENRLSRNWLDAVPGRQGLYEQIKALVTSTSNSYGGLIERNGTIFAFKRQPPKQQPLLVALSTLDSTEGERVIVDPNAMSKDGTLTIDFFEPSLDGRKVAVSMSEKGSEDGTLHVFDVATGKELGDSVPRAAFPTGGGAVAWNQDGSGLYYTRYPAPGERAEADIHFYQQVWFHKLGSSASKDRYSVGKDFPRIAETALATSPDGRYTAAIVESGDGGDYALYLATKGRWRKLAGAADGVKAVRFGGDGYLYLMSRDHAPKGKILRTPLEHPDVKHAEVVMAEEDGAVEQYAVTRGKLYVTELQGGPSRLQVIDLATRQRSDIAIPPVSAVDDLAVIGEGKVAAQVASYLQPTAWYALDAGSAPRKTALAVSSAADFSDAEVVREFATSKDGTKVPLNILRRKGTKLDGNNPTLLYGYGGFGVSMTPHFMPALRAWLDHGGVFVIANIRGGGEFGDTWHTSGNLTQKQNVFDDFIAAAEYLVKASYTNPQRLAIQGGSNGGLLMGAVLTQRPDLFRAVSSSVGIYDMLRVELDPNGAFNVTEFGSVKDKAQFDALYAYSPFHHVKDGTPYPAVMMMTGDHDGRVNPAHSRKMIARLQAADPHGHPILLRTSANSGHGMGTALSERINETTDDYAFLLHELGVDLTK